MIILHTCTMCVPGTRICQKRVSNPLELEPQLVSRHHVGFRNQPGPLQEQQLLSQCSSPKDHDVKNKSKNSKMNPANKRECLSTWPPPICSGVES